MKRRLFISVFVVILILGVLHKLYYAYRLSGYIDCDSATIGLMARDVINGKFNIFFYGQNYNGALEAFCLALFILLFGSKTIVLYIGMIFLFLLFLLTMYKLGSLIANKYTGLFAMACCAISTYPLLHNSVFPYGYHMTLLIFGNLVLVLALLLDKDEKNILLWLLLGICAGLGFWNHLTIVYYLAPAGLFLCFKRHIFKKFKYYLVSLAAFIFSGLPFWMHNLKTNFSSFNIRDGGPYRYYPIDMSILDTFKRLAQYHISGMLGIQELNIFGCAIWILFIISAISFFIRFNRKKFLVFLFAVSFLGFSLSQKFFVISPKYCYFIPFYTLAGIFFACFADLLNQKLKCSGTMVLVFILFFNINDFAISTQEGRHSKNDEQEYAKKSENYKVTIDFLNKEKINGVIADFEVSQALNFMTAKKTAGAELVHGRMPTDELVQARDRLAIFDCMEFLKYSLDEICKNYSVMKLGAHEIVYGFKEYGYYGRTIDPKNWKAVSNYNKELAFSGFDRSLDKFWYSKGEKSPGMYYKVDLDNTYKIYKLVVVNIAPHLNNLPASYKIEVSIDGKNWDLAQKSKDPQPLFWSGPRLYWDFFNGRWEVIFKPVDARYIRIRQTGFGQWSWMINELFIYEYLGEKGNRLRDYIKPAKALYQYLTTARVEFVYADSWLSAKVREWSKNKIKTLGMFNNCYPTRKYVPRLMEINKNTAIIINTSEENEFEKLLKEFKLPINKKYYGDYICYRFPELNDWQNYFFENQKCLYWIGFSAAKINMHTYSQVLAGYGIKLEENEGLQGAAEYYRRALGIFPRNNIALERLVKTDKKYFIKLKHLYRPEIVKRVEFKNGIVFMGYRLLRYKDRLRMEYYWQMPEQAPKDLAVFVHFYKDGKLVFQNDHNLLEHYPKPVISLNNWVFAEKYWVKMPKNLGAGSYEINIGLYNPATGKRITAVKKSLTKFEIGTVDIK